MEKQNSYKKFITILFCTVFGIGFLPVMPGTFASLAVVGIFFLVKSRLIFILLSLFFIFISFLTCRKGEKIFNKKDPKQIVIDEFAGQSLALLFIPEGITFIFLGFFLFRMFDIFKIYPANILEKRTGPAGIVLDDLVAGIYANITIQLLRLILSILS